MQTRKRSLRRGVLCLGLSSALLGLSACGGGVGPGTYGDLPFIGDAGGGNDLPQGQDGHRGDGTGGGDDGGVHDRYIPVEPPTYDPDAFFINDPPPPVCPLDGGMQQPPMSPGGTPDCPDDKNRQGCPCPMLGMHAACWPGARKNRDLGQCKDGMTVCQTSPEGSLHWGECMGYVLPDPNATAGAAACECFSQGTWKIDNLSPCFFSTSQSAPPGSGGTVSTVIDGSGQAQCPSSFAQPTEPWSPNSLNVDCAGHFQLCFTLKAGDGANPQPTDCTIIQVCTESDYPTPNVEVQFPPLQSWISSSSDQIACAEQFTSTGGYGEMSVMGKTVACDDLNKVFNRVTYCPIACSMPNPPAMCAMCRQDGSGNF
jgi:hypothetical protein